MDTQRTLPDLGGRTPVRGRNVDDLRRTNMSIVLGLLHRHGSMSRAELTALTGLNRSTIATLVAELEELELVTAGDPVATKRKGRPSPEITASERFVAISVTPEIDATTIAVVAMGGRVLRSVRFRNERIPTAREVANVVAGMVAGMLPELEARHRVVGIGLAVPGLVRAEDGHVLLAPRLGWTDEPLAAMVAEATGLPTWAANDANCGVTAESTYGSAAGARDVVYVNGGATGIGAGVLTGGALLGGFGGFGGELGHTLVRTDGAECRCGARGCLEAEVDLGRLLVAGGLDPSEADDLPAALEARVPGSPLDGEVVRQGDVLAIGLRNMVNACNPEVIVLGGFLAGLHDVDGDRIDSLVRRSALHGPADQVRIVSSTLGGRANRSLGAADLVFRGLLADPAAASSAP